MTNSEEEHIFVAGKAKWLLDNAQKLSGEQRALLLAVADLDVASGHKLTAEERAALNEVSANVDGYDAKEIEEAVRHMVKAKSKRKVVDWPSGLFRLVGRKK
jgi:hypothetical protein